MGTMGKTTLAVNPTLGTAEWMAVASRPSAPPPNPKLLTRSCTAPMGSWSCGLSTGHAEAGHTCSGPKPKPVLTLTRKDESPAPLRTQSGSPSPVTSSSITEVPLSVLSRFTVPPNISSKTNPALTWTEAAVVRRRTSGEPSSSSAPSAPVLGRPAPPCCPE